MSWGFADSIVFAAVMTLRDLNNEKSKKLFKTQKFYQECYNQIADDSKKAFDSVLKVVKKASRRYIPTQIVSGGTYLGLYAFALVIERQGRVTHEQNKVIKIFFDSISFPFSQSNYLSAVKTRSELGDFRNVIAISKNYAGGFWVDFFRALYKSGTQQDLQDVINCVTSMIVQFSILGDPNSILAPSICSEFVESVNYQINRVRKISMNEIDWLGVVPIPDRLKEMKSFYESLIDNSQVTDSASKSKLLPLLENLIFHCICDVVMMTDEPKSVKLQMINDAVNFSGIHTMMAPDQYIKEIANGTQLGIYYKEMFSSGPPLGLVWRLLLIMGDRIQQTDEVIAITNNILSILLQIENYLGEKYDFLGQENIAKNYMMHIFKQVIEICNKGEISDGKY